MGRNIKYQIPHNVVTFTQLIRISESEYVIKHHFSFFIVNGATSCRTWNFTFLSTDLQLHCPHIIPNISIITPKLWDIDTMVTKSSIGIYPYLRLRNTSPDLWNVFTKHPVQTNLWEHGGLHSTTTVRYLERCRITVGNITVPALPVCQFDCVFTKIHPTEGPRQIETLSRHLA